MWGDISTSKKLASIVTFAIQAIFRRICMDSSEVNGAYILTPNSCFKIKI